MQREIERAVDRTYRERQASVRRIQIGILAIGVLFWGAVFAAAIWGLRHPEAIGAFFGRIANGFGGA